MVAPPYAYTNAHIMPFSMLCYIWLQKYMSQWHPVLLCSCIEYEIYDVSVSCKP